MYFTGLCHIFLKIFRLINIPGGHTFWYPRFATPTWWNRKMALCWSSYFFMSILKDAIKIQQQPQIILIGVLCSAYLGWQMWREWAQHSDMINWDVLDKSHSWESIYWIDSLYFLTIHEFWALSEGLLNVNLCHYGIIIKRYQNWNGNIGVGLVLKMHSSDCG
jgi:hypothetical protein